MTTACATDGQRRQGSGSQPTNSSVSQPINVRETERIVSTLGGAALAIYGLSSGRWSGLALAAVGGGLVYRGLTGHCAVFGALGINTADQHHGRQASVAAGHGFKVEETITINQSPEQLYRFWRDLSNLPHAMSYLESVTVQGSQQSHWIAKGPAGSRVEWDAEIINERPNELIAWRSLPGSQVDNAGSVHFHRTPGGQGTEVKVTLKYDPPAGKLGGMIAELFGQEPEQQIRTDLRRFKQMIETGQISMISGAPSKRTFASRR